MALPQIEVTGNVQRIETRTTQGGKTLTEVSISCGDKKKDGTYDNFYITATFWDNSAVFVSNNYHEGSAISVRGELMTTHYEKNGTKVYKTEMRFPRVVFLPRDRESQNNASNAQGYTQPPPQQSYADNGQPQAAQGQQQPAAQPQGGVLPEMTEGDIPFSPIPKGL
jgi:single-stranded DNA-binding protein